MISRHQLEPNQQEKHDKTGMICPCRFEHPASALDLPVRVAPARPGDRYCIWCQWFLRPGDDRAGRNNTTRPGAKAAAEN